MIHYPRAAACIFTRLRAEESSDFIEAQCGVPSREKPYEKERKKKKTNLRVHYGHPTDEGLAANVNDSMDAGGMAAADVTQAASRRSRVNF